MMQHLTAHNSKCFSRIKRFEINWSLSPLVAWWLDFTPGLPADEAIRHRFSNTMRPAEPDQANNTKDVVERVLFPMMQTMIARSERWNLHQSDMDVLPSGFQKCMLARKEKW